jgi:hypothetical protein
MPLVPAREVLSEREQKGVDDGVARDDDLLARHAFAEQVLRGPECGREVQIGDGREHPAVGFLGIGMAAIEAAQPRLDVRDGDAPVKSGEGGAKGARRVSLHDDPVGLLALEQRVEPGHRAAHDVVERLAGQHDVEIDVRHDSERIQDLVQHLAVLPGHDDAQFEAIVFADPPDDRQEFHGFRPRTENRGNRDGWMLHSLDRPRPRDIAGRRASCRVLRFNLTTWFSIARCPKVPGRARPS